MPKILPINNVPLKFINNKNNKSLLKTSLLALSILSAASLKSCSKSDEIILENKSKQIDSTEVVDNKPKIIIDTTTTVIEHFITI